MVFEVGLSERQLFLFRLTYLGDSWRCCDGEAGVCVCVRVGLCDGGFGLAQGLAAITHTASLARCFQVDKTMCLPRQNTRPTARAWGCLCVLPCVMATDGATNELSRPRVLWLISVSKFRYTYHPTKVGKVDRYLGKARKKKKNPCRAPAETPHLH